MEKYVRGERFAASFETLAEAADWKKNFHPGLNWKPYSKKKNDLSKRISNLGLEIKRPIGVQKNGNDLGYTFGDVWELYVSRHLSTLEASTFEGCTRRMERFYGCLIKIPMVEMTADEISRHVAIKKKAALKDPSSKRYSFTGELKDLQTLFNWYRENIDAQFVNPILKRHRIEGEIKKMPKKHKKMRRHELKAFFEVLEKDGGLWSDLAETQFYFSGRIQEAAGLQWDSVDFTDGIIFIDRVAVWSAVTKAFQYLKGCPKNKEDRLVPMTEKLRSILERRFKERKSSKFKDGRTGKMVPCNFVFHEEGKR